MLVSLMVEGGALMRRRPLGDTGYQPCSGVHVFGN